MTIKKIEELKKATEEKLEELYKKGVYSRTDEFLEDYLADKINVLKEVLSILKGEPAVDEILQDL